MKAVVHYPKDGKIYMTGECGRSSVCSTKELKCVTCEKCLKIINSKEKESEQN